MWHRSTVKCEMDRRAEVALPAGGNNIFKARKSVLSKNILVHSRVRLLQLLHFMFSRGKAWTDTVDQRVYYTLCQDIGLSTYFHSKRAGWVKLAFQSGRRIKGSAIPTGVCYHAVWAQTENNKLMKSEKQKDFCLLSITFVWVVAGLYQWEKL